MNIVNAISLPLDGSLTQDKIIDIVRLNIKQMCFEEPEKKAINLASEALAIKFLKVITLYTEIQDTLGADSYATLLIKAADSFLWDLKKQVAKHANLKPLSTGLLFTWVPIVMLLNRSAKEAGAVTFQSVTTYLELETHKFAMSHLNLSLNKQTSKMHL